MLSAARKMSQRAGRDCAQDAHGQAGAGEGLAKDDFLGQAQFQAQLADLILEQAFERLDQFEFHVLGQAADVVVALDQRRRVAGDGDRFDDIGIKCALREKPGASRPSGRRLRKPR